MPLISALEAVGVGASDDIVDFFRVDAVFFQDDARDVIGDRADTGHGDRLADQAADRAAGVFAGDEVIWRDGMGHHPRADFRSLRRAHNGGSSADVKENVEVVRKQRLRAQDIAAELDNLHVQSVFLEKALLDADVRRDRIEDRRARGGSHFDLYVLRFGGSRERHNQDNKDKITESREVLHHDPSFVYPCDSCSWNSVALR